MREYMDKLDKDTWRLIESDYGNLKRVFATDDETKTYATCTFHKEECFCETKRSCWIVRLFQGKFSFDNKMYKKVSCCKKWLKKKAEERARIEREIIDKKKAAEKENMEI